MKGKTNNSIWARNPLLSFPHLTSGSASVSLADRTADRGPHRCGHCGRLTSEIQRTLARGTIVLVLTEFLLMAATKPAGKGSAVCVRSQNEPSNVSSILLLFPHLLFPDLMSASTGELTKKRNAFGTNVSLRYSPIWKCASSSSCFRMSEMDDGVCREEVAIQWILGLVFGTLFGPIF